MNNLAWRDIYIYHILPKLYLFGYFIRMPHWSIWKPEYSGHHHCMNHPNEVGKYHCLKCGIYASLCLQCCANKSNVHYNHPKTLPTSIIFKNVSGICENYYMSHFLGIRYRNNHSNIMYQCLQCDAFICSTCISDNRNTHYQHPKRILTL